MPLLTEPNKNLQTSQELKKRGADDTSQGVVSYDDQILLFVYLVISNILTTSIRKLPNW